MKSCVQAKAAFLDGSGLSISRVMLSQPQPGTAWGELSSGKWVEGPWPERGPGLHGTVEHPWPHKAGKVFMQPGRWAHRLFAGDALERWVSPGG